MLGSTFLLTLLGAALVTAEGRPCGFRIAPCPSGEVCQKNDPSCDRGENCAGTCVPASTTTLATITKTTTSPVPTPTYVFCDGIAGIQCKGYGQKCYDDPRDTCDPTCGGTDCGGICLAPEDIVTCGGITGKRCPAGTKCYDYPDDSCDPRKGGADCIGFCI